MKDKMLLFGKVHFEMFAYVNKNDANCFGVLEASSQKDARSHLGSAFYVRKILVSSDELADLYDRDRVWSLVNNALGERL